MPEAEIKARGGALRYRTVKRAGETFTCAVTRKAGPKGGKTICWKKGSNPK